MLYIYSDITKNTVCYLFTIIEQSESGNEKICRAFETHRSQWAKVYVVDMNKLSESFEHEFIKFL